MRRLIFFLALPVIGLVGFVTPFLAPSVSHAESADVAARGTLVEQPEPRPVAAVYRRAARPNAESPKAARANAAKRR